MMEWSNDIALKWQHAQIPTIVTSNLVILNRKEFTVKRRVDQLNQINLITEPISIRVGCSIQFLWNVWPVFADNGYIFLNFHSQCMEKEILDLNPEDAQNVQ